MNKHCLRALACLCALGLAVPAAAELSPADLTEDELPVEEIAAAAPEGEPFAQTDYVEIEGFPPLNSRGFLDAGEFVQADEEAGVWRYASATLRVEINRRTQKSPSIIWYEAEVWAEDGELFHVVANDPDKRMTSLEYPYKIARKNQLVLAINGDFSHLRVSKKQLVGVLLRAGEVVSTRTGASRRGAFPNLDTAAFYPDGSMLVYESDELTAEEYQEQGAYDVMAFGPWLIRDGELNTWGIKKFGTEKAQRTAVGMVEPGHYILLMAEGRHKGSLGATIRFCAERLQELGCTQALNLDGGQSSAIVFMGRQICTVINSSGYNASARKAAEILGIGTSSQVADMEEKMNAW